MLLRFFLVTLVAGSGLLNQAVLSVASELPPLATKHWTADMQSNVLVNVAADSTSTTAPNAKFQVVDLGLGRVALKAANGRFVSATENGACFKWKVVIVP